MRLVPGSGDGARLTGISKYRTASCGVLASTVLPTSDRGSVGFDGSFASKKRKTGKRILVLDESGIRVERCQYGEAHCIHSSTRQVNHLSTNSWSGLDLPDVVKYLRAVLASIACILNVSSNRTTLGPLPNRNQVEL